MIEFLCGCKIEKPELQDEFSAICGTHRLRKKGFLSPSAAKPGGGTRLDISRWAEITSTSPFNPDWQPAPMEDKRDLRDPAKMGLDQSLKTIAATDNAWTAPTDGEYQLEFEIKPVHSEDSKKFFRDHPADTKEEGHA